MGRKVKELTLEEKFEESKHRQLNSFDDNYVRINEPTYSFNVGEIIRYGSLDCEVLEIIRDGKAYITKVASEGKSFGDCRVIPWFSARPIETGDTSFTKNEDIKLNFLHTTIEGFMHYYYSFGINMEPKYQRDYVWEDSDREYLIDSIFSNIDIGKFALVHKPYSDFDEYNYGYEILDGKQRLDTIIKFYENRFPYHGKYYNDLSNKDRITFKNHTITYSIVEDADEKTILKYFLLLNRGGKIMDKKHLSKIEVMLNMES